MKIKINFLLLRRIHTIITYGLIMRLVSQGTQLASPTLSGIYYIHRFTSRIKCTKTSKIFSVEPLGRENFKKNSYQLA